MCKLCQGGPLAGEEAPSLLAAFASYPRQSPICSLQAARVHPHSPRLMSTGHSTPKTFPGPGPAPWPSTSGQLSEPSLSNSPAPLRGLSQTVAAAWNTLGRGTREFCTHAAEELPWPSSASCASSRVGAALTHQGWQGASACAQLGTDVARPQRAPRVPPRNKGTAPNKTHPQHSQKLSTTIYCFSLCKGPTSSGSGLVPGSPVTLREKVMFKFKQELKTTEKHKTRQIIFHRPQQPQFRKVNRNSRAPQGKNPGVPLDTFKHPGVLHFPSASVPNVRGENIPVQASPAHLQVSPPALPGAPSSQAPSQQLLGPGRRVALPEVHHALEQAEQTTPDLNPSTPAS